MLSSNPFGTLQGAYNDANPGGTILARDAAAVVFLEDLDCSKDYTVTLQGGLDSNFLPTEAFTTIKGSMKISAGKVTVNRINLQSSELQLP
jgi:hypothetical protein